MPLTPSPGDNRERGSAPVEFVLVGTLVVLIGLAVIQLVLALHVRNTLTSSAFEGARYAAQADHTLSDGQQRSLDLTRMALGGIDVESAVSAQTHSGVEVVVVTLEAPVPLVGLWGPGAMTVTGRAFSEPADVPSH